MDQGQGNLIVFQPINAGAICGFLRGFHGANRPTMGLANRDHDSGEKSPEEQQLTSCLVKAEGSCRELHPLVQRLNALTKLDVSFLLD